MTDYSREAAYRLLTGTSFSSVRSLRNSHGLQTPDFYFKELIDIPKLQELTDYLYNATGIPSAIIAMDGEVITGSGWQDICVNFHRRHPEIEKECMESDIRIRKGLDAGEPFIMYRCPRGLVDASSPVIIENVHVANVFAGQLFTSAPGKEEEEFFRSQALKYGFDLEKYMEAFRKIPVMPEERFRPALAFLSKLAQMIAQAGLARKRELEAIDRDRIYKQIVTTIDQGIIVYGPDLSYQEWNPYMERLSGLKASDVLGKHPLELFPFLKDAGVIEGLERVLKGETPEPKDFPYYLPRSGKSGWTLDKSSPLKNAKGEIVGITATVLDITGRRQAEEKLYESEEKYRTLYENMEHGVFYQLADGTHTDINPAGLRMFGITRDQFLGRTSYHPEWKVIDEKHNILKPEDHPSMRALANGRDVTEVVGVYNPEKKDYLWLSITAKPQFRPKESSPYQVFVTMHDITALKRTEEALREQQRQIVGIFNSLQDAYFQADLKGNFTVVSPSAPGLYGYESVKEMTGIPAEKLYYSREKREELLKTLKEKGKIVDWSIQARKKDGSPFWVSMSAQFVYDGEGRIMGTEGVVRDISDRKNMESQLLQAQKMESVGRLAGGVAHDFNNMLSAILGHAELALDRISPDDPVHEDLLEIHKAAERSANLTRQLLAFARKMTIKPVVLDLNGTIEGMLKMLRRLIGENITLIWKPGINLWSVKMDPSQIDQILANLIVNARDAITETGEITIKTEISVFDKNYYTDIPEFIPGEYVQLSVSDNGCGMSRDTAASIFEPFFTTKDISRGTGLGLPTVYGIVRQNNGFINVYSDPGLGSIFRIYLPKYGGAVEKAHKDSAEVPPVRGSGKILLVEDEPAILKVTASMLTNLGYTVIAAGSPDEAVIYADGNPGGISLLITDVIMPGMNGSMLSENLKNRYPGLKTLFMSGYTADVIASHGVLEKDVNFIQKPFSIKDLAEKVKSILEG